MKESDFAKIVENYNRLRDGYIKTQNEVYRLRRQYEIEREIDPDKLKTLLHDLILQATELYNSCD